jgi:3-oxoacyl-[acyl-carrier protein] reductase
VNIRFDGKVALITGASSGIGRATALEFGRSGAHLVVNYNSSVEAAEQVVHEIQTEGGQAIAVQADVSRAGDIDHLVQLTLQHYGRIDILVNNAGTLVDRQQISEMDESLWDRVMDVNLKSVFLCCQAVIPHMKKLGGGRIINVTSVAARNGGGLGAGHYSAAKAGVLTLSKNLAKELAGSGIMVNAVSPGVIATLYHDKFTHPDVRGAFLKTIPLGREGTPEEVAAVIVFLASEYASYILGETIEINGGVWMD